MPIISDGNNRTGDELTDKHTTIGKVEHTGSYVLSGTAGNYFLINTSSMNVNLAVSPGGYTTNISPFIGVKDNSGNQPTISILREDNTKAYGGVFNLSRASSTGSVGDGDVLGTVNAFGHDGTKMNSAAEISFEIDGTVSNDQVPGSIKLKVNDGGGSSVLPSTALIVKSDGKVGIGTESPSATLSVDGDAIFNESGADKDFRVESTGMTHALFVDASTNMLGINTGSPKYLLDIKTNNGGIRLGNTENSGEKSSNIHFTELASSDGLNAYGFSLNYNATDNAFNVKRHNNNTSGVSMMNFSRAFGNIQMGDVDPSRFGGTGVPKLWVNADVNDRGIIRCSQHTADSDPPQLEISKARGTMESPVAVESLDYIAQLRAMGHDGTDFQISSDLLWIASDDFTSTSRPSTLTIRTVASGTTTPAERMRITHDGNIGIGTTSPNSRLDVNGDLTVTGSVFLQDATLQRSGSQDFSLFSTNEMFVGAGSSLSYKIKTDGNVEFQNAVTSSHFKVEGSGGQFVAHNEDTVKLKHVNWYSSNDRQYGQGQLWYQQWFGAVEETDAGAQGGRRIGFFFHKPNKGASDADGGSGAHPTNTHAFFNLSGMTLQTGSLDVTSGDVVLTGSLKSTVMGPENEIVIVGSDNALTSSNLLTIDSANQRVGIGTSSPSVKLDMVGESSGETQIRLAQHSTDTDAPDIRLFKSRGTEASPTAVADDDNLARVNSFAYNGSSYVQAGTFGWSADGTDGDSYFDIRTRVNSTTDSRLEIDPLGDLAVSGSIFVSGSIKTEADISFVDENGTFPTNTAGFFWDLNNDEARIYAQQPASDQIDFVFKLSDNNNSVDRFVYWIDDYRGGSHDRFPLVMHGSNVLFHMTEDSEGTPDTGTSKVRIDSSGRILMRASSDPSTTSNYAHIYSKDVSSSAEVFVRDEAGNVTQISPHNDEGEWQYFSRNTKTGKVVKVNMEKMIRRLEEITGESFMEEWYEDPTE